VAPTKSMAEARTRDENESFIFGGGVGGGACVVVLGVGSWVW